MTKNRCEFFNPLMFEILQLSGLVFCCYLVSLILFIEYYFASRVVDTLKDYAIRALVNTVDHLGSVTYKVNDLLDEKVDEVSGTELRVSCIEQVC